MKFHDPGCDLLKMMDVLQSGVWHFGLVYEDYRFLWKIKIPPKIRMFLWLVLRESILIRDFC